MYNIAYCCILLTTEVIQSQQVQLLMHPWKIVNTPHQKVFNIPHEGYYISMSARYLISETKMMRTQAKIVELSNSDSIMTVDIQADKILWHILHKFYYTRQKAMCKIINNDNTHVT